MTIQDLQAKLPSLSDRDRAFAQSLIKQSAKGLSAKQLYWVDKLCESKVPVSVGSMTGLVSLFDKAAQHLKYPAIKLQAGDITLRISRAGAKSTAPGSINVADQNERNGEGRRLWYGRVSADGQWLPSGRVNGALAQTITDLLGRLSTDPAGTAAEHGRLTGRCCFCGLPLSDARSTAVGYGQTCADHYDLPWGEAKHSFQS